MGLTGYAADPHADAVMPALDKDSGASASARFGKRRRREEPNVTKAKGKT